jgi:outer membrane protein assembly factor BamA
MKTLLPVLTSWLLTMLLFTAAGQRPAVQAQTGGTRPVPATAYKLVSVKATGTKRFTSEEVAAASGLPVGTIAHEDDFRKAARQLGESGAFSNIAFTYSYSAAGTKLEFQAADADHFVPARFTDFVWSTEDELRRKLHERIPLFKGELPTTGRLADQVSDVLQALLVESGVPGHVEYLRKRDKSEHVESIEYNVAGVSIRVRELEFAGAGADERDALQTAGEKLIGREYSREFMNSFVERVLLPIYHERGYLKAACGPPQPQVVKPAPAESNADSRSEGAQTTVVKVTFPITPGIRYKLSEIAWSGNKEFSADELRPLLHAKAGESANTVQLADDLRSVQALYGSRGYILASIKVEPQFDDGAGTVALRLAVDEGSVYRMGELEFRGIDNNLTARLRAAWKIRSGEVYDATYLKQFLPQARKLLPANLDWEVEPHVTAIARDKTVDVDLQYAAKAPQ